MDTSYQPSAIEQSLYQQWEKAGYFSPKASETPYCIMIPPPNVTGSLHMGHGFQHTLMDTLIRYHRMQGNDTLWQVGCDHAGIATQMVVERHLNAQGQDRHQLGREKFVEQVQNWRQEYGRTICQQIRRMGSSVDWQRERFTMDPAYSTAVQTVFIRLYQEGLIYRGKRLVNWDPKFKTAISDLEVISTEESGSLWYIRYPLANNNNVSITIATTRPETLLGDVAVAVHPDDERYKQLIGQLLILPLTDRQIPIIADDSIDPSFGTGCVKVTPAHDFNDYAIGQRHGLTPINIMTEDATLNDQVPTKYRSLDRFVARQQIIDDLQALNLLEKIEPHTLKVPKGDRSGVVIEPLLTDQWFVKMHDLAQPAIAAVQNGDIAIIPETWQKTYYQWLENIQDWCISRQLWWGHRIPAWYDINGKIYVGENEAAVREHYQLSNDISLSQDNDVLDTWFSSALWPFATLGWPTETADLEKYFPSNVLVTGFDIIFFWVARMVMFSLKFTGKIPFKEIYITGLIRDAEGQKMSKTKGNVLDPIDLIDGISLDELLKKRTSALMQPALAEKIRKATQQQFPEGIKMYGTDALRFTFCALASTGRDIRFDLGRVEGYRNFCNKLWNAARYILMQVERRPVDLLQGEKSFSLADQWILAHLQQVIAQVHQYFKQYRFDLLAQTIYEFIWNNYCDWYLELSKPILSNPQADLSEIRGTQFTLITVFETLLRLIHPIMPFITEEIWQKIVPLTGQKHAASIMLANYPQVEAQWQNATAIADLEWLKQVIIGIRTIRSEMNISPSKTLNILFYKGTASDQERINNNAAFLKSLARLESINWLSDTDTKPFSATALVNDLEILIPMAGLIDKTAELNRLNKEIAKLDKELERATSKLDNSGYIAKAPAAVIEKERERLTQFLQAKEKLTEQYNSISLL